MDQRAKLLEGIKVADFSWLGVGPTTTMNLGEYGATIVKIESGIRPDGLRTLPPFKDNISGIERSQYFAGCNNNKYSIRLNLNHPKMVQVSRRLLGWADIVVESFTPGNMERWGLGYEDIRKIKPDIIMLSTCMQGQTGPAAKSPGHGITLTALTDFNHITGWPDRAPPGIFIPYTDWFNPQFNIIALLAALDYRQRTGKGQYLDVSQYECGIQFLAPVMLDYTVNGREFQRMGNRSPCAAPHGIYRCRGEDRWCAITVSSDEEWDSFCKVIGNPKWTTDFSFATLLDRKRNEEELDRMVEEWTIKHSAEEIMTWMQYAGVPAGVVATGEDVWNDPQLTHYKEFYELEHPEMGMCACLRCPVELSKSSYEIRRPPLLGEHTEYVCREFLMMPDEEFASLLLEGVFE